MFLFTFRCVENKEQNLNIIFEKIVYFSDFANKWGAEIWDIFYLKNCKKPDSPEGLCKFIDQNSFDELPTNKSNFYFFIKNEVFGGEKEWQKWNETSGKEKGKIMTEIDNANRFQIFVNLSYGSLFSHLFFNVCAEMGQEKVEEMVQNKRFHSIFLSVSTMTDFFNNFKNFLIINNLMTINDDIENSLFFFFIQNDENYSILDSTNSFIINKKNKIRKDKPVSFIIEEMKKFYKN